MVCAIGKADGTILEQISIPTTTPQETIPKLIGYFKDKKIEALQNELLKAFDKK